MLLGDGKEGEVFLNGDTVEKRNKEFGHQYHFITKYVYPFLKKTNDPSILDVQLSNTGYSYKCNTPFKKITDKQWKECLSHICFLNAKLLKDGIALWDFGIPNNNFMYDGKKFVLVDYGGSGFCFTEKHTELYEKLIKLSTKFVSKYWRRWRGISHIVEHRFLMLMFFYFIEYFYRKDKTGLGDSRRDIIRHYVYMVHKYETIEKDLTCDLSKDLYNKFKDHKFNLSETWQKLGDYLNV